MSYGDGNAGGFCIDSGDGNTYNLRLFSYVQAGSQVGYNFQVNNISLSVKALTFDYDGGVNINKFRISNKSIYNNLFYSSGYGTLTDFNAIFVIDLLTNPQQMDLVHLQIQKINIILGV
jgi:hypothetical protein